ncbi:N-acetyl-gamma-glutamyl-phosphate reductase [Halococcoides cellulosivorans]|uniref:N-acetyl-gamma-glutamyl-phosphate reductase n=1 Tax=Halococcoides cellulosivorans TaxID=1679096 RepID=A0A2R4WY65_9EURY|nr:N-acetyl-gamma-glutamyl-phosphate reductase [Halococcoides cellulosivorans]AWB26487.1 N-acetyl-gamma-glutamyl-phosphate reductase [Halococcoides cellulosivorans]
MSETYTASVVGGTGFTGGELLRLLADHSAFDVVQATSRSDANRTIGHVHPNLRDLDLRFSKPDDLASVDVLFAATPHGVSMDQIDAFRDAADTVVDLSADFRLPDERYYDEYYDGHSRPELLEEATYALPELNRDALPGADLIASGGCNATATMLGLYPLVEAGILEPSDRTVVDVKVGSSEGGAGGGAASSHPERSGVVRPYAPTGHRHEAEIEAYLDRSVDFTVHAVDMIRGASATCHTFPEAAAAGELETVDLWTAFRDAYGDEPFVDLVAGGGGVYRYPEPKAVAGTNRAEIGFAAEDDRVVVFAAIDNMMKGSAGQAVHAANVALGLDETAGLDQRGLHPVGAP